MTMLSGLVAIVREGAVVEYRDLGPGPVQVKPNVLPVEDRTVDTSTGPDAVVAVTVEIGAASVIRTTTMRDRTASEVTADKDRIIDAADRVLFQIAFNHENRIRALEAKQSVTAAQFRTAVRALI